MYGNLRYGWKLLFPWTETIDIMNKINVHDYTAIDVKTFNSMRKYIKSTLNAINFTCSISERIGLL